MTSLPESFYLPTGAQLDETIEQLHQDIQQEGSALFYLGAMRQARRSSQRFNNRVLAPLAARSLRLENEDSNGRMQEPDHLRANTAMAGMIFGHMINEPHYPLLTERYHPYHQMVVNIDLLGTSLPEFISAKGIETPRGRQIGYSAMAGYCLNELNDQSSEYIREWAEEVIHVPERRTVFAFGIGLALYGAKYLYGERLIIDGREEDVTMPGLIAQSDSGND